MSKHTPTPWGAPYWCDSPGDRGWWIHNGRDGGEEYAVAVTFAGNPRGKEDAAYIVRAVNAHEGLVRALTSLLAACDQDAWRTDTTRMDACMESARAALSAAKE